MKHGEYSSNIEMVESYLKGERPITQVGYREAPDLIEKNVGDVWTDSKGKSWKKTEYGKVSVTPIMDMVNTETDNRCPSCKGQIKWMGKAHERMFAKTGRCLDCQIDFENELRKEGKLRAYAEKKIYSNELAYISDVKDKLEEALEYTEKHTVLKFVNANGLVDEWEAGKRTDLIESLKKDLDRCDQETRRLQKQIASADATLNSKFEYA